MQSVSVVLILLVVVVALATAYPNPYGKPHYDLSDAPALFQKFIKDYNRHYKDEEDYYVHYFAFLKNLVKINQLNEADGGPASATFDINQFADYTKEEEQNMHGLINPDEHPLLLGHL